LSNPLFPRQRRAIHWVIYPTTPDLLKKVASRPFVNGTRIDHFTCREFKELPTMAFSGT
jgi:hypothetical protein